MKLDVEVVHQHPRIDGRPLLRPIKSGHESVDLLRHRRVVWPLELRAPPQPVTVVLELVGAQVIGSVKAVRQERCLGKELRPALQSKAIDS